MPTVTYNNAMKEMIRENPGHGHEMLEDALNAVFADDLDDGRLLLRSYINATIGFSDLGRVLEEDPEALKRALGSEGTPTASNLFEMIQACANAEDLKITVRVASRQTIPAPNDRVACHPADLPAGMLEALEQSIAEDEAKGIVAADLPVAKF